MIRKTINKIRERILPKFLRDIFSNSQTSSLLLSFCTLLSLVLANVGLSSQQYVDFWSTDLWDFRYSHFTTSPSFIINDVLMPVFFFVVGYEIRHELFSSTGSLNSVPKALLPFVAALGGVIVPAFIYYALNANTVYASGWAIPTATDIAFSLAVASMLGSLLPNGAKILLMALAVFDDIIAVLVIAIFYSAHISVLYIVIAVILMGLIYVFARLKYDNILLTGLILLCCLGLWYAFLESGIHPTLSGVIIAFLLDDKKAHRSFNYLHQVVAFLILPLFILANTAIPLDLGVLEDLTSPVALGIILGLFLGKPLGVSVLTTITNKLKITKMPPRINLIHIFAVGSLAGIGFTMSILIANLAFDDYNHRNIAKLAIILASLLSGVVGVILIKMFVSKKT